MRKPSHIHLRAGYWALLFLLLSVGHSGHPLNSDEGVILNGAWNLRNGFEPYTDFFEIVTPGGFYAVYWLWELFGPHYMVAKAFAVLSLFSACIGIHLTGRLLALNGFSYAGPVLYALASFGWPLINHNTFNMALLVWATYFFARSLGAASLPGIAISGLAAGLSALFLQHKSAVFVLATAAFLLFSWLAEKRSIWLKGLAAYLLCAAAPLLLLLKWPLPILYENLVHFPLFNYMPVNKVPLWPFYLACLALLGSLALVRGAPRRRQAAYLVVAQAALLLTTLQRTDYMHVSIALAPLLALMPYLQERAKHVSPPTQLLTFSQAMAFVTAFSIETCLIALPEIDWWGKGVPSGLIAYVQKRCGDSPYLYAGPFLSGLYYETHKLNATSFSVLLTHFNTPQQFEQARKELEIRKPECVVMNYAIAQQFNYDTDSPVDEWIKKNHKLEQKFGQCEVYVRAQ